MKSHKSHIHAHHTIHWRQSYFFFLGGGGFTYVNSRATQGLEAPPRTSALHLASDPGSRPSAAQSWPELSMTTRPGQRTLEAARGNGYAPVRGTPVMMTMMTMMRGRGRTMEAQKYQGRVRTPQCPKKLKFYMQICYICGAFWRLGSV